MSRRIRIDYVLLALLAAILIGGVFIFASAVFGVLARGSAPVSSILLSHLGFGVGLGLAVLACTATIDYRRWKPLAPYLFGASLIATALVFIPGLGLEHGGAKRWIILMDFSIQPSESIKIGAILLAAAYFSAYRTKVNSWLYGMGAFVGILAIPAVLLLLQPDTGTFGIIAVSVLAIFFMAGARYSQLTIVCITAAFAIAALAFSRPYIMERIETLINPANNPLSSGYQIRQSFIAIGSGGVFGRGFGQSVQKFSYLPEPVGDSIFAVAGEEFGFIGGSVIVGLFLWVALRGFRIATRAPDMFGALLAIGISTYLVGEAFLNIASMAGIAPLTGVPLTFISQGGTAMLVALGSAGILLNISRYAR